MRRRPLARLAPPTPTITATPTYTETERVWLESQRRRDSRENIIFGGLLLLTGLACAGVMLLMGVLS